MDIIQKVNIIRETRIMNEFNLIVEKIIEEVRQDPFKTLFKIQTLSNSPKINAEIVKKFTERNIKTIYVPGGYLTYSFFEINIEFIQPSI